MVDRNPKANRLYAMSLARPILVSMVLLLIIVLLRIVDIFLLPLAQMIGEAFLHKALGLILVLAYVRAAGQPLREIGLHRALAGKAMWIGASGAVAIFCVGFGLQWILSSTAGKEPALVFSAIDPQTGMTGGALFTLWMFVANVVNSLAEEGLFRGVMLTHFRRRLSPWKATLLQAAIFGLWHITWPTQRLLSGQIDLSTFASQALINVLGSSISGLAYGYLYLKTDSLWAPWLMHTINNSVLNLIHIRTVGGLDADIIALNVVILLGYLAQLVWTKWCADRWNMPQVKVWGAPE